MRSPRLRDTDGTEYDPETGERAIFDRKLTAVIDESASRLAGKIDALVASHKAPPDEKQAALPATDETVSALAEITATLAAGQRADDLSITEERWEELRLPSEEVRPEEFSAEPGWLLKDAIKAADEGAKIAAAERAIWGRPLMCALGESLPYAAPDVLAALKRGEK